MQLSGVSKSFHENSVCSLFLKTAKQYPSSIALIDANSSTQVTYNELLSNALFLKYSVLQKFCDDVSVIGLCFPRSIELIISMVAVLLSGKTFVYLNSTVPIDRNLYIMKESNISQIITSNSYSNLFHEINIPSLSIHSYNYYPGRNLINPISDEDFVFSNLNDICYFIFTSGSTGYPKGVKCTHSGLVNRIYWMQEYFKLSVGDNVLHKTPCTFDVSMWEIFWPLSFAGCIIIAKPDGHMDTNYLKKLMTIYKIHSVHFVPSLLKLFLDEDVRGVKVNHFICSGEKLDICTAKRFFSKFSKNSQLHNLYGPSEASIDVTYFTIESLEMLENLLKQYPTLISVPIGIPVYNTSILLKDIENQEGKEIIIEGVQVAAGYLNNREPCRFTDTTYCTGDLGITIKIHDVDNLVYLRRTDKQFKLFGVRIEVDEIESVLSKDENVSSCIILTSDSIPFEIFAFVILKDCSTYSIEDNIKNIKDRASKFLPDYMIPNRIFTLTSFPLTCHSKVDIQKLKQIALLERKDNILNVESDIEYLLSIMRSILQYNELNVNDNFFAFGGDSIKALQLISEAKKKNIQFTVTELYRYPTASLLQQCIKRSKETNICKNEEYIPFSLVENSNDRILMKNFNVKDIFPMSQLQKGMVYQSLEGNFQYQVVMSLIIDGIFKESLFTAALVKIIEENDILKVFYEFLTFNEPMQLVRNSICINDYLLIHDIQHLNDQQQSNILSNWFTKQEKFNFNFSVGGILFQVTIHILSESQFHFGLVFHDTILDGWSRVTFIKYLFQHYSNNLQGKFDSVPIESPVHYSNFIQAEKLSIDNMESKKFWKSYLKDVPSLILPRTKDSSITSKNVINVDSILPLSKEIKEYLIEFSRNNNVPLKSTLLALHFVFLTKLTNTDKVISGIVFNGRIEQSNSDKTLGNHLNTLPVCIKICKDSSPDFWKNLVQSVYQQELQILPHRRYPLANIIQNTKKELFNTAFNFTDFHNLNEFSDDSSSLRFKKVSFTDPFHYPLVAIFRIDEIDRRLDLIFNYDTTFYSKDSISSMSELYLSVINECISNTIQKISPSSILTNTYKKSPKGIKVQEPTVPLIELNSTNLLKKIQLTWEKITGKEIHVTDNIFHYGVDSFLLLQFCFSIREYGWNIFPSQLFEAKNLQGILQMLIPFNVTPQIERNTIHQFRYPIANRFLKECSPCQRNHWNAEAAFYVPIQDVNLNQIQVAIQKVMEAHDVFNLKYSKELDVFKIISNNESNPLLEQKVSIEELELTINMKYPKIVRDIVGFLHSSLDIDNGLLFKGVIFYAEEFTKIVVVIVSHHIFFDAFSMKILAEEFVQVLIDIRNKINPIVPISTQLHEIAKEFTNLDLNDQDKVFWENMIQDSYTKSKIPKDITTGKENTESSCHSLSFSLSISRILYSFNSSYVFYSSRNR